MIQRRQFITLVGGAAAWPIAARAQQAMPVVGVLGGGSPDSMANLVAAYRRGLREAGYAEGRDVAIEYSWAEGHNDRMPALAGELARHSPAVIAAVGGAAAALAARAATKAIPIVFITGGDPVKLGLVASLNRPGGNLTGVSSLQNVLIAKQLQLLRDLLPAVDRVSFLANPTNPNAQTDLAAANEAAVALGRQLQVLTAVTPDAVDAAFEKIARLRIGALIIEFDPFLITRFNQIAVLAARHAVPALNSRREFAATGGLISYGSSSAETYRQAGAYTARILNGEKPADLPVMQPTKFDLVINLTTAKALGLTVPASLLAVADEVIE
jgi:putative tryptophan/tyrosine transport system substrate-binding protein